MLLQIEGEKLLFTPSKIIYWEKQKAIILSDIHLGKVHHFRANGLYVPEAAAHTDLVTLTNLIKQHKAEKLIVCGDMFHSVWNSYNSIFEAWRKENNLEIHLIKGNHDIINNAWLEGLNINVHETELTIAGFTFIHEIPEEKKENRFYIYGHIHPSISMPIGLKQSKKFPCFYIQKKSICLPAFADFSGSFELQKKKAEIILAIVGDELIKV
jgi:DNA ligase-associated metallophosphoesterase